MKAPASRDASHFERLYAANPDPWDFATSDYERRKYDLTLAVLAGRRFGNAFEAGCSIGVLTARLAPRCAQLLAADIAPAAVAAAKERCGLLPQVRVEQRRLPAQWPAGRFDLILLSEILYFLTPEDLVATAKLCMNSLEAGGLALLVNYTGSTDDPCSGDEAAEIFAHATRAVLTPRHRTRHQRFRVDLFQK